LLNKRNFSATTPTLEFFLARDRVLDVSKVLKPYDTVQVIALRKAFHLSVPMLVQTTANVVCDPGVQSRAMFVRQNVDPVVVVAHASQRESEMFRFAQHDKIQRFND
jgi:hypothetical protein